MTLGAASFAFTGENRDLLIKASQAEAAAKKSYESISKAAGVSAADVERAANKMIAAHNQSAQSVRMSAGEWIKGAASIAGFNSVTDTARKVIEQVATSTAEAQKAQFALSKAYGSSAPAMAAWAKQFGDEIGRSTTEVTKAATTMAVLVRTYGVGQASAKLLVRQTADLAAANGEDLAQSAKDVQSAIRGEAEAAEKLGVALNDTRVATSQLGADGVKLWGTLTEEEKATLRLLEIQKQLGNRQDAAIESTQGAMGAFNRLQKSTDELSASIGERLLGPAAAIADVLADMANNARTALEVLDELAKTDLNRLLAIFGALANPIAGAPALIALITETDAQRRARQEQARVDREAKRAQDEAAAKVENERKAAEIKAIAEQRAELERRKKAADDLVEIEQDRIDREREANDRAYEQKRTDLEVEREARIKASEAAEKAAIASIEAEAKASEEAYQAQIERAEQERDAEIAAAESAKDAAVAAIEARKQALEQERELEDRALEDRRRAEDQALDDQRAREDALVDAARDRLEQTRELEDRARDDRRQADDQDRSDRRQAEDREVEEARAREDRKLEARVQRLARQREVEDRDREDRREVEDREIADRREAEDRAAESAHEQALARLEEEHEARLAAIDAEIDGIKTRADAETDALDRQAESLKAAADRQADERERAHEQVIDDLDAEADRRQQVADDARRAIDEQAQAEDDRHRRALQALEDEKDARLAEIDAALGLLDAQDEADQRAAKDRQFQDAVTNARLNLQRAEGTGNYSEILEAQQELADAEDAIRKEGVKRERDAARAELQARKDAVSQGIEQRKRAEDEANESRERELDDAKSAIQDQLDADLAAIKARRDAEQTAYDAANEQAKLALESRLAEIQQRKDAIAAETEDALAKLQARRDAEQTAYERARDRIDGEYDLAKQRRDDQREQEDRALSDRREAEDRDRDDRRRKEDDQLDERRRRIDDRRAKEDRALADTRGAEDRKIAETRAAEDRDRSDRRTAEDRQWQEAADRRARQRQDEDRVIGERRLAEDRDRADRRREEDLALSAQLAAVDTAYETERRSIDAHYNGPGGVLPTLKQAMQDAKDAYADRLRDAREKFAAEREAINAIYSNTAKTGLLDKLEEAKRESDRILGEDSKRWEKWRKDVVKEIEKAEKRLKEYQQTVSSGPNAQGGYGSNPYGPNPPEIENPPDAQVAQMIRQAFEARGIPAEDALRVWAGEGKGAYVGDEGSSFGPFQLHYGGISSRSPGAGLGEQFTADTGLNARDPSTVPSQIRWVADYVRRHGWNNQWHGAPADIRDKRYAAGHLFTEPTLTYGLRSRQRGVIGETGHPERLLGVGDTQVYERLRHMAAPSLMAGASTRQYTFAGEAAAAPSAMTTPAALDAPIERQPIVVRVGGEVLASWYVDGRDFAISSGMARSDGSVRR